MCPQWRKPSHLDGTRVNQISLHLLLLLRLAGKTGVGEEDWARRRRKQRGRHPILIQTRGDRRIKRPRQNVERNAWRESEAF